jgi:hypothetical protein
MLIEANGFVFQKNLESLSRRIGWRDRHGGAILRQQDQERAR